MARIITFENMYKNHKVVMGGRLRNQPPLFDLASYR
jgi:hypothetical protein